MSKKNLVHEFLNWTFTFITKHYKCLHRKKCPQIVHDSLMVPPKHNYFHSSKTFAYNDQVEVRGWICIKKIDLQEDQLANLMVHKMSFLSVIFLTLNWLWLNHTKNNNCYSEEKPYSNLCQLHSSQATIHKACRSFLASGPINQIGVTHIQSPIRDVYICLKQMFYLALIFELWTSPFMYFKERIRNLSVGNTHLLLVWKKSSKSFGRIAHCSRK